MTEVLPGQKVFARILGPQLLFPSWLQSCISQAELPPDWRPDLMLAGHRAWECLSVSEALYICEREWIDAIVIAPDVEAPDFVAAQLRYITIQLEPEATAKDLIWD